MDGVHELKSGLRYEAQEGRHTCLVCGKTFETGEVYKMGGRFYEAERAAQLHMTNAHPTYLQDFITGDGKYNGLTENQRELLVLFAQRLPDQEIAKIQGVSVSTIRQQKFVFREKAKRARWYLAAYEAALESEGEAALPRQDVAARTAKFSQEEQAEILGHAFSSMSPLRLESLPKKEKKRLVVLQRIVAAFETERTYTEKEVNKKLQGICKDYVAVRRHLLELSLLRRSRDGKTYWRP